MDILVNQPRHDHDIAYVDEQDEKGVESLPNKWTGLLFVRVEVIDFGQGNSLQPFAEIAVSPEANGIHGGECKELWRPVGFLIRGLFLQLHPWLFSHPIAGKLMCQRNFFTIGNELNALLEICTDESFDFGERLQGVRSEVFKSNSQVIAGMCETKDFGGKIRNGPSIEGSPKCETIRTVLLVLSKLLVGSTQV